MSSTTLIIRPKKTILPALLLLSIPLACAFLSCAPKPKPVPEVPVALPGFELPPGGTLWLALSPEGSYVPWPLPESADGSAETLPSNFAVHMGPAAIEPLPNGGAILASNRSGLHFIELAKQSSPEASGQNPRFIFTPVTSADGSFAKRTVAGSWLFNGKAMVLLNRNPIFETEPFEAPGYSFISADRNGSTLWSLPGTAPTETADAGIFSVYACYARSPDSWAVQLRKDSDERVDMLYEQWSPGSGKRSDIGREAFEKSVKPAGMARAPETLQELAGLVNGAIIVSCRMEDGSRSAFTQGNAGNEDSLNAYAQIGTGGTLLVIEDGRAMYKNKSLPVRNFSIPRALPDATIRDAALVDGVLVVIWEEDLFPDVGDCGLLIFNLGL